MHPAGMDEMNVWHGHLSHPPKRQKNFHDDPGDAVHGLRNGSTTPKHDDYTIAWICALYMEMAAARAMLDEVHESLPMPADDSNNYILGSIKQHNVVITCLPDAQYGTNNAVNVVANMKRTFSSMRLGLMVGIGGGVPSKADVRLGDIVVGTRVMQNDLGKVIGDGQLRRTAIPRILHQSLGTVVSTLRAKHELLPSRVPSILLEKLEGHPEYNHPSSPDRLFQANYDHVDYESPGCDRCDHSKLVLRSNRPSDNPIIHYGAVASGNQVMRHGRTRDEVARQLDVICFEMEAAGLMDIIPCLPIRGICDYSDSHKNKHWQRYAAAVAAAYARELLEELPTAQGVAETGPLTDHLRIQSVDQDVLHSRRQRLLESLKFEQIDSRKTTIKAAYSKTCQWFLDHPEYRAWLDPQKQAQHHGFLWIRGKPGVGKSTIMKFIYLKTKKMNRCRQAITASFFFNARGEHLEKSIPGMYRSLLLQLFEGFPDLQALLEDPDLVPRNQRECPSLNVLKDLFSSAVSALGQRSFTCFVDALDECDEQQVIDMVQYFEELAENSTKSGIRLQICFSSRHYPYIDIKLGIRLTLENQVGHVEDLASYVRSHLRIQNAALVEELQPQILEKSAGVFLWVVLVVDILNKENRRGRLALKKRLVEVPSGLSELFKDILRRDNANIEELLLCIIWILYAKRPLTPKEYYHALWSGLFLKDLADPEIPDITVSDIGDSIERCVISSSKGFAEITKAQHPTVQFIHEAVRDFLIKDGGLQELWSDVGFDWKSLGHERLKQCCNSYMNHQVVAEFVCKVRSDSVDEIPREYPFLEYASQHVLYHADVAADTVPQDEFLSGFHVPKWTFILNLFEKFKIRKYSEDASLFYLLAEKGFSNLIRARLKEDPHIHIFGDRYGYPLFAALANGNKDAVAALLRSPSSICDGVDITEGLHCRKDLKNYKGRTPLSWAAQEGRVGMIELLLRSGAIVNDMDQEGRSSLSRAVENGHEAVAQLLIDSGADVNSSDQDEQTPMLWALRNGHEAVVKLLIDNGVDVNSSNRYEQTLLSWASIKGQEAVAKLLIDNGADVNFSNQNRLTPLSLASQNGHEAVVKLLIDNGADFNFSDQNRLTPLSLASQNGHEAVVKLLIDNGADFNFSDQNRLTPLSLASKNGHEAVAKLLIDNGVDVNSSGQYERTPLLWASMEGQEAVAKLLIDNGADVNFSDQNRLTPLSLAFQNGHEAVVKLLIDNGANVNFSGPNRLILLSLALQNGHEAVAKLLTEMEEYFNSSDQDG